MGGVLMQSGSWSSYQSAGEPDYDNHPDQEPSNLASEREEAFPLLEEFEIVAHSLRRVLQGKGDEHDARVIRANVDAWGRLVVMGTADWETILRHRATQEGE